MKKVKSNFKVTPEIQKNIEIIAAALPQFQRTDDAKKLLTRRVCKVCKGHEIEEKNRIDIVDFDPEANYKRFVDEPLMVNHAIALKLSYLSLGQPGVDAYCKFYADIYAEQTLLAKK